MGGSFGFGGSDAVTEFNVRPRPGGGGDGARSQPELGISVTVYPLDVFFAPTVTRTDAHELVCRGARSAAELAGRLVTFQCDRFGAPTRRPSATRARSARCVDPDGLTSEQLPVRVELTGIRGQTTIARSGDAGGPAQAPNHVVRVATAVDGPRYADLWLDAVR